jgi:hypothetical protein
MSPWRQKGYPNKLNACISSHEGVAALKNVAVHDLTVTSNYLVMGPNQIL